MAGSVSPWWKQWDPNQVTIADDEPSYAWKLCVLQGVYYGDGNGYNGRLGVRISAVFVILVTSLFTTTFPVIAVRFPKLRIPSWVYLVARNFGSGVIVTTAFIHLMDPSYDEIGANSCVGEMWNTGKNADYSWNAALMLVGAVVVFLVDAYCDFFADVWYGVHDHMTRIPGIDDIPETNHIHSHADEEGSITSPTGSIEKHPDNASVQSEKTKLEFRSQFAGFLVLEFGILFHSVMIGLNLGITDDIVNLYIVLIFHQAFEGLGIGARLSQIPFPKHQWWLPYFCCIAYAFTTPVCTAIGIGVRKSYNGDSYVATLVQGVLDSLSAGILFYTGFVELLGRDFIFNPNRTKKVWNLTGQLFAFLWGAGLMALLGKWA